MAEQHADVTVVRNDEEERFEIRTDGEVAILNYSVSDGEIALLHTEVPEALSGNGLGSELVRAALEHARSERLAVLPLCPFVQAYLQRHPQYRGLARSGGSGA